MSYGERGCEIDNGKEIGTTCKDLRVHPKYGRELGCLPTLKLSISVALPLWVRFALAVVSSCLVRHADQKRMTPATNTLNDQVPRSVPSVVLSVLKEIGIGCGPCRCRSQLLPFVFRQITVIQLHIFSSALFICCNLWAWPAARSTTDRYIYTRSAKARNALDFTSRPVPE